jgi:chromosome partitioning protein
MCKSIVFTSSKGGISKSTSVQTVGVILSQLGYKVLCVDTDNQSHLSTIFLKETAPESLPYTLTNLVESFINQELITKEMVEKAIVETNTIDLLPSTFLLDKFEIGLNTINGREYFLSECLEKVEDLYDYIILDCNSSRNVFTINSLAYASELVIPCQSQFLCLTVLNTNSVAFEHRN